MLLAAHHLDDLAELLERRALATERNDVSLEERYDSLAQHVRGRDLEDEHLWIARLRKDLTMVEGFLRKLQNRPAAHMLIQEESWINVVARPAGRMLLDTHAEGTLALD